MGQEIFTQPSASTESAPSQGPTRPLRLASAAEVAAQFRAFRPRPLASAFNALPWLALGLGVVVEVLLLISGAGFDPIFATGALAAALVAAAMKSALARFPHALEGLHQRSALHAPGAESLAGVEARLALFLEESESLLNHRLALLFGLAGAAAVAAVYWPFRVGSPGEWAAMLAGEPRAWLSLLFYLVVYALGFAAGWLLWRPVALAVSLGRVGGAFDFDITLDHPDGCGGFSALGDLSLGLAVVLAGPALFFGGWALGLSALDSRNFVGLNELRLLFGIFGAACAAAALAGFFGPAAGVSQAMRRRRSQVQARLLAIDREIRRLSRALLENSEEIDPAAGRAQEERLDFLRRVYARNRQAPVWPFSLAALLQVLALQAVPLAGLAAAIVTFVLQR